jgi:hypothetical protein
VEKDIHSDISVKTNSLELNRKKKEEDKMKRR